jgi:pyruvate dehydrogenase E1 component beta subunit
MPYAANLEKLALPQADDIVAAAEAVCTGLNGEDAPCRSTS